MDSTTIGSILLSKESTRKVSIFVIRLWARLKVELWSCHHHPSCHCCCCPVESGHWRYCCSISMLCHKEAGCRHSWSLHTETISSAYKPHTNISIHCQWMSHANITKLNTEGFNVWSKGWFLLHKHRWSSQLDDTNCNYAIDLLIDYHYATLKASCVWVKNKTKNVDKWYFSFQPCSVSFYLSPLKKLYWVAGSLITSQTHGSLMVMESAWSWVMMAVAVGLFLILSG